MYRVFIGWDSRFPEPALVLADSIRKRTPRGVDVRFLDLEHLKRCYGFKPAPDPNASTEFTRSRFLVPWLCGYEGYALFVDNDVLAFASLTELSDTVRRIIEQTMPEEPALYVVKHDHCPVDGSTKMYGAVQTAYPRKNWSSFMVMHCPQLKCWTKELVETAPCSRLHRFVDVPDSKIAALPHGWNDLDHMDEKTKMIHYTSGGPWYEQYKDCPHADVWLKARFDWLSNPKV